MHYPLSLLVCTGWAHTLHQMEAQSTSVTHFPGAPQLCVQSLDPDAPIRERRALADADRENEEHLVRALFQLVRCGYLDEAQHLCSQRGHSWRAATLLGWTLFHDANLELIPAAGTIYCNSNSVIQYIYYTVHKLFSFSEKYTSFLVILTK